MSSIVLELQRGALNSDIRVSDLLRKAFVVARKLNVNEFEKWILLELNGYPDAEEKPQYRTLLGQPAAFTPFNGVERILIHNLDAGLIDEISTIYFDFPISQFEADLDSGEPQFFTTYKTVGELMLTKALNKPGKPGVVFERAQIQGILDAVRNIVLEWSLKLEQDGILGEELSFTQQEKQLASAITYNIQNLSGDLLMGDSYKVGQAGAVGPNSQASHMTFNQIWNEVKESVDLAKLAEELVRLRQEMKNKAVELEQDIAISEIAKAELSAKIGNGSKTLEHLKNAGKFALDVGTKIGTNLAVEVIKKAIGE